MVAFTTKTCVKAEKQNNSLLYSLKGNMNVENQPTKSSAQ